MKKKERTHKEEIRNKKQSARKKDKGKRTEAGRKQERDAICKIKTKEAKRLKNDA